MAGRISRELQRTQARWLREWQRYMVRENLRNVKTALEVGCGCGYIMENIGDLVQVVGIDSSEEEVNCARARGLSAMLADGHSIPYPNNHFDLAYGNYLLMWVNDPRKVVEEMLRVSRRYIAFFAEPYWNGAIYHPDWLEEVVKKGREMILRKGGNPDFGLMLGSILKEFADDFMIGTIPLYSTRKSMRSMVEFEVELLRKEGYKIKVGDVDIFYVPTIWAIVEKSDG